MSHLRLARRLRNDNGYDLKLLDDAIRQGDDERALLDDQVKGRVFPRKRPRLPDEGQTCTVFIDECGAHSLTAKEKFKAFALSAIIVPDSDYRELDRRWKEWKRIYLGRSGKLVHEPDIRDGAGSFFCNGSKVQRGRAIKSLGRFIARQDFGAIVCVLLREEYVKKFGHEAMDDSLPHHGYMMTVHFMAERLAMALQEHYAGARARVVMESREKKEDAFVQYEFARLFIDGTTYISAAWFRQALCPGIEFRQKKDNLTGLQVADLAARPVAEKILAPETSPDRWPEFRDHLCHGVGTANSILGLKVIPWDSRFERVWKS